MKKTIILLLLFCFSITSFATTHIVIGQSNMNSQGEWSELVRPKLDKKFITYDNDDLLIIEGEMKLKITYVKTIKKTEEEVTWMGNALGNLIYVISLRKIGNNQYAWMIGIENTTPSTFLTKIKE